MNGLPAWQDDPAVPLAGHELRVWADDGRSDFFDPAPPAVVGECRCRGFRQRASNQQALMLLHNHHMVLVQYAIHYAAQLGAAALAGATPPPMLMAAMFFAGTACEPTYGPPPQPNG